jgi:hypothetical protein
VIQTKDISVVTLIDDEVKVNIDIGDSAVVTPPPVFDP